LKLATQPATLPMPPADWKPATEPSIPTTIPTTQVSAPPTSRPIDPLEQPDTAVRHFLDLCGRENIPSIQEMRDMIAEPPPENELVVVLDRIRRRLTRGAQCEIVQTHRRGTVSAVIYRMDYRGRASAGKFMLIQQRDDRWKIVISELTPGRYTPGEKEAMALENAWANDQLAQLNAVIATQSVTKAPASAPTSAPVTPSSR
jgi:hypothetical protein